MRSLDPRLLRRAREARLALAVDVSLGFLATIALLFQASLIATVVAGAFDGDGLATIGRAIVLLVFVAVARSLLGGGFEATGRWAAAGVMSRLRLDLVERRLRDDPLAADGAEAGEVAAATVQGVDGLEAYFARYLPQLVLTSLVPVAIIVWTATIDLTSAAIMLLTIPLIVVFMALIGRQTAATTRARWKALARLSSHFLDVLRGLPTLRAFNRGAAQTRRIEEVNEEYRRTTMETLRVGFLSGAVLDFAATIATALVAVTLGIRLIDGDVAFRAALVVLLLTPEVYAPLRALSAQYHASADGLAAAERILELTERPDQPASGTGSVPGSWRSVRLEGVTVTHPGRGGRVLEGLDLEIRRGEVVALMGPSGAGKSTVASLVLGLRSPDGGAVTVDGADLAGIDLAAWREQVGWLPQRPTLFRGSVRENIAIGDPAASSDRIRAAAALAGADGFISELRRGYDTRIGDGGRGLSAGETRRVALARAIVRDAPLLILDEPTANLDEETANAIGDLIRSAASDRAVLVIEHRPQLAALADRTIRIENGSALAGSAA